MVGQEKKPSIKSPAKPVINEVVVEGKDAKGKNDKRGPTNNPTNNRQDPGIIFTKEQKRAGTIGKHNLQLVRSRSDSNLSIQSSESQRSNWFYLSKKLEDLR